MIQLLSRQESFQYSAALGAFVAESQDLKYNPMQPHVMAHPGDWMEGKSMTQEDCDDFNREAYAEFLQWRDQGLEVPAPGGHYNTVFFEFPKGTIDAYPQTLGNGMLIISAQLNWDSVLFLLDHPQIPWLSQDNDHPPVQRALEYLRAIGMTPDFNGGVVASGRDLAEWMGHLFWLIRCNASLPECYFSGPGYGMAASICQYGNIHFFASTDAHKLELAEAAREAGMFEAREEGCRDSFSTETGMEGRRLGD